MPVAVARVGQVLRARHVAEPAGALCDVRRRRCEPVCSRFPPHTRHGTQLDGAGAAVRPQRLVRHGPGRHPDQHHLCARRAPLCALSIRSTWRSTRTPPADLCLSPPQRPQPPVPRPPVPQQGRLEVRPVALAASLCFQCLHCAPHCTSPPLIRRSFFGGLFLYFVLGAVYMKARVMSAVALRSHRCAGAAPGDRHRPGHQ